MVTKSRLIRRLYTPAALYFRARTNLQSSQIPHPRSLLQGESGRNHTSEKLSRCLGQYSVPSPRFLTRVYRAYETTFRMRPRFPYFETHRMILFNAAYPLFPTEWSSGSRSCVLTEKEGTAAFLIGSDVLWHRSKRVRRSGIEILLQHTRRYGLHLKSVLTRELTKGPIPA